MANNRLFENQSNRVSGGIDANTDIRSRRPILPLQVELDITDLFTATVAEYVTSTRARGLRKREVDTGIQASDGARRRVAAQQETLVLCGNQLDTDIELVGPRAQCRRGLSGGTNLRRSVVRQPKLEVWGSPDQCTDSSARHEVVRRIDIYLSVDANVFFIVAKAPYVGARIKTGESPRQPDTHVDFDGALVAVGRANRGKCRRHVLLHGVVARGRGVARRVLEIVVGAEPTLGKPIGRKKTEAEAPAWQVQA